MDSSQVPVEFPKKQNGRAYRIFVGSPELAERHQGCVITFIPLVI